MRLVRLPVNSCWAFLFGDTLVSIGSECRTLFPTREEAVSYVSRCGLDVGSDGTVSVRDAEQAES